MLLYKNHRFHCEGVSFAIPDGYFLDTSYEGEPPDTLHLWSPDGAVYLQIGMLRKTCGPAEELNTILRDIGCTVEFNPSPVLIGCLAGYCATYASDTKQYWEAHQAISGEGVNQVELLLMVVVKVRIPSAQFLKELISGVALKRSQN